MKLTWMGHLLSTDGYGIATIKTAEALERAGVEVTPIDMMMLGGRFSEPGEMTWTVEGAAVVLTVPDWWEDIRADRLVGFTMFEASRLPADRVRWINWMAERCLVPCEWNRQVFAESGVTVPMSLVPFGVDPVDYHPPPAGWRRSGYTGVYRFLWSGTPDGRKGWDVAYRAFLKAFGDRKDVQLTMHFRERPNGLSRIADPNVKMLTGRFGLQALRRMYWEHDVYVFPSRGEGWGLPPREAAACGLPVIATDGGGLAVDGDAWKLPLRVKGMVPTSKAGWVYGDVGDWFEPDLDHLVELMRWCEANRLEAQKVGLRAAIWTVRHGTWDRTARAVVEALQC